jgi:hypothetical protein
LCELTKTFGTARNRRELLEMIFASAMEILEGKAACLYLLEPGKPELMPVAQKGLSESYFRSKQSMLVQKIVPLVLKKGFFYCRDAAGDPKLAYPNAKSRESLYLAVPVMVKVKHQRVLPVAYRFYPGTEEVQPYWRSKRESGTAHLIDHLHRETSCFRPGRQPEQQPGSKGSCTP